MQTTPESWCQAECLEFCPSCVILLVESFDASFEQKITVTLLIYNKWPIEPSQIHSPIVPLVASSILKEVVQSTDEDVFELAGLSDTVLLQAHRCHLWSGACSVHCPSGDSCCVKIACVLCCLVGQHCQTSRIEAFSWLTRRLH